MITRLVWAWKAFWTIARGKDYMFHSDTLMCFRGTQDKMEEFLCDVDDFVNQKQMEAEQQSFVNELTKHINPN